MTTRAPNAEHDLAVDRVGGVSSTDDPEAHGHAGQQCFRINHNIPPANRDARHGAAITCGELAPKVDRRWLSKKLTALRETRHMDSSYARLYCIHATSFQHGDFDEQHCANGSNSECCRVGILVAADKRVRAAHWRGSIHRTGKGEREDSR